MAYILHLEKENLPHPLRLPLPFVGMMMRKPRGEMNWRKEEMYKFQSRRSCRGSKLQTLGPIKSKDFLEIGDI